MYLSVLLGTVDLISPELAGSVGLVRCLLSVLPKQNWKPQETGFGFRLELLGYSLRPVPIQLSLITLLWIFSHFSSDVCLLGCWTDLQHKQCNCRRSFDCGNQS